MGACAKENNIVHGPEPIIPIVEGTAGQQLFDTLVRYQHLPAALEYIVHGPEPLIPVVESTAGQQLFDCLGRYEHLPAALVCAETHKILSFKDLLECSRRVACSLVKCGLTSDSVVSIFSENSLYYYFPVLASLFLGVVVAPLSPDYVKNELHHAVNIAKPQILFCSKNTLRKAFKLQEKFSCIRKIIVMDLEVSVDGVQSLDCFMSGCTDSNQFYPVQFDPNERVAFILNSSGTTGLPKGAMITHKNLSFRFAQFRDPILGFVSNPATTVLSILPLYHIGGLLFNLTYILLGFRTILMRKYSGELFLKLIQDYKVYTSFVAPPVMAFLAKSPLVEKYDLSSLRDIGCGAAPLSKEIIVNVLERLPYLRDVRQAYGLTETTLTVTYTPRGDAKFGSTGKLFPYMSAKVVDVTNKALGPYQQGELCFKGGLIMKGYISNGIETANIIRDDGWLHTGDIGYYDKDEHFYVVDRLKELIKYKGYQVSPVELEALLLQHHKIKDAAVIGIDDELAGQLPRAYVVKQPNEKLSEDEVYNFIADQVSFQKHLHGGVVFLNELPRIPSGKVARKKLRELSFEKLSRKKQAHL